VSEFRLKAICLKAKTIYRNDGILPLIGRIIKKSFFLLFEMNRAGWFERGLSTPVNRYDPRVLLKADLSSKDETLQWIENQSIPWANNPREDAVGLEQGHYFPNVKYQGKIVGYMKIGYGKVYIQDFKKDILPGEGVAFVYDSYVLPNYRGLGIAPFLMTGVMVFLKKNGFKKVMCHIPPWNHASISFFTKCGFKKTKSIAYFKIFGMKIFTTNPETLLINKG